MVDGGTHTDSGVRANGARAVDPLGGGELDGVDVLPGSLVADELGLVQRVECLGQGDAERSLPWNPLRWRHHSLIGPARSGWLGTARRG